MLETIWFVLWGILWAIYFMLDGYDFGCGMLLPFVGKETEEKRQIVNAIGPFWDGNEVWLITAGGVTFAAFPTTYAVMFSSLYVPLLVILFGLIIRGVSVEFMFKLDNPKWQMVWEVGMFIGSLIPALFFGVAFANIFAGLPLNSEGLLEGNLLTLLNPYGVLGGILFIIVFLYHSTLWLKLKTKGALQDKITKLQQPLWISSLVGVVIFLVYSYFNTILFNNYIKMPALFLIPLIAAIALLASRYFSVKNHPWKAWISSCKAIFFVVLFGVIGIYPNLLPSVINPKYSLSIYNSASSELTLKIMLGVVLIFIPIVVVYQTWAYFIFKEGFSETDSGY